MKKRTTRTQEPGYFFGSAKAADSRSARLGQSRTPSKLPTSLDELTKALDDLVYNGPGTGGDGLFRLVKESSE